MHLSVHLHSIEELQPVGPAPPKSSGCGAWLCNRDQLVSNSSKKNKTKDADISLPPKCQNMSKPSLEPYCHGRTPAWPNAPNLGTVFCHRRSQCDHRPCPRPFHLLSLGCGSAQPQANQVGRSEWLSWAHMDSIELYWVYWHVLTTLIGFDRCW